MLNKSFLFGLVALVAAPLAFGAAPEPFTKTFLGVEHKCIRPTTCWSEKYGYLISPGKDTLIYVHAVAGTFPIVKQVRKDVYQAWVTYVSVPPVNDVAKFVTLVQVNAKTEQQRNLQVAIYDKSGDLIKSIDSPDRWTYMIPGSRGATINAALVGFGRFTDEYGAERISEMNVFKPKRK